MIEKRKVLILLVLIAILSVALNCISVSADTKVFAFSPENVSRLTAEQYLCPLYEVDANFYESIDGKQLADPIMIRGNFELQCLEDEFNRAFTFCYNYLVNAPSKILPTDEGERMNYLDNCIVQAFFLKKLDWAGLDQSTSWDYIDATKANTTHWSGRFYLKTSDNGETCESVTDPDVIAASQICDLAELRYIGSPVSLLLCDDCDLDNSAAITQFPIDPTHKGNWFTWMASEKAPLLVYDPDRRGLVKDATQLFGNWTFGGRAVASIMITAGLKDVRWNNGYEPLALMDKDNDSKISGVELDPLALWFDYNRNGVSEPGEVKRLSESGITALYYHPNRVEADGSAVYADRGFSQIVDGKEVIRRSVDWFSESSDSATELVGKFIASGDDCKDQSLYQKIDRDSITPDELPLARNAIIDDVNGAWRWKITGGDSPATEKDAGGFFTFAVRDGKVIGHSLFELKLKKPVATATTSVHILPLSGTVVKDTVYGDVIHFSSGREGQGTKSKMLLENGGTVLKGETKTIANRNGKKVGLSFTWRATKLKPKKPFL